MILAMLRWLMQHIQNATRNRLDYSKMACEMQLDTRIQIGIEILCSLYDAPSPVHAQQMNDACMRSIRMLIEICPKTTH